MTDNKQDEFEVNQDPLADEQDPQDNSGFDPDAPLNVEDEQFSETPDFDADLGGQNEVAAVDDVDVIEELSADAEEDVLGEEYDQDFSEENFDDSFVADDQEGYDETDYAEEDFDEPRKKSSLKKAIFGLILIGAVGAGGWYYLMGASQGQQSASAVNSDIAKQVDTKTNDELLAEMGFAVEAEEPEAEAVVSAENTEANAADKFDDLLPPVPTPMGREGQAIPTFPEDTLVEVNPVEDQQPEVNEIAQNSDSASTEADSSDSVDIDSLFAEFDMEANKGETQVASGENESTNQSAEDVSMEALFGGELSNAVEEKLEAPVQENEPDSSNQQMASQADVSTNVVEQEEPVVPQEVQQTPEKPDTNVDNEHVASLELQLQAKDQKVAQLEASVSDYQKELDLYQQQLNDLSKKLEMAESELAKKQKSEVAVVSRANQATSTSDKITKAKTEFKMPSRLPLPNKKPMTTPSNADAPLVIRGVTPESVMVSRGVKGKISQLSVGDTLEGIGTIRGIRNINNVWTVIGDKGIVTPDMLR